MVQPKVRIPEKDAKEVAKTVLLLKKRAKTANFAKKAAIELQLKTVSEHIRSLAEAQLRGDNRPVASLNEIRQKPADFDAVDREWAQVIKEYDDKERTWAQPALDSETKFQKGLESYSKALDPLIAAFQSATSANIPGVKSEAKDAIATLTEAQATLIPLGNASKKARAELEDFCLLVDSLKAVPPDTLPEVRGARARFDEAIQKVRTTQQDIKNQVTAINNLAQKQQKSLEGLIKKMVAAAVAWRQTGHIREGTEVLESLLNGTVSAVQALDGEPMSALALQGVHSLIKGVCDGIKLGAAGVKGLMLHQAHKDVMGLIDKLEDDDFIQAKLDLLKMGLSWAVEPLGLIPNVGAIVRSAINIAVGGAVIGTLKKAAAKQAREAREKRGEIANVNAEIGEAAELIRGAALEYVKAVLAGTVKALAKPEEGVGELLLELLGGVLGEPLQRLVAEVVGEFDLVDKEEVKKTVRKGRDAVEAQAGELAKMAQINMKFAFDEIAARKLTVENLDDLDEGSSCEALVAASPELKSTRGVALLIGAGHSENNVSFVTSLLKAGEGYRGTVLMKEKGGSVLSGEVVFDFPDERAKELVKSYISHYGSGDSRITRKKLTFK